MGKLRDAGLGDQVDSWVSTGQNQPIDPDAARPGARAGHGPAAVGGLGHRHRAAAADAGGVPAADHRHAHPGRPGAGRRPDRRRACPTSAACSAACRAVAGGTAAAASRTSTTCSAGSAACSAATRAADRRPGVDVRPSTHVHAGHDRGRWSGAGRRGMLRAWTRPPASPPPASAGSSRRSRSSGCPPSAPTATPAHRPDLVLVGRRGAPGLLQARRPEGPQPARRIRP